MTNVNESSKPLNDRFVLLWVVISTIFSPIAIFAGLVATYIFAPWNTGVIDPEAIPDSISLLIVRSITFAIVAGVILEFPRWLMLRQFSDFLFWIPATIISLAIGVFVIYVQDLSFSSEQSCLTNLPIILIHFLPLVLSGLAQSLVLAKNNKKWLAWLIAGSTSYLFPLSGFIACTSFGLFTGSFIAAIITVMALPITMERSYK